MLLTTCNGEGTVPTIHYLMNEGAGGELRNAAGKTLAGTMTAAAWASGAQRSVLLLDGRKTFAVVEGGEGLTFPGNLTVDLWFWPDRPIQGGPFGLAVKSSTFRILVTPMADKLRFLIDVTSGAGKGRVYESFEASGDEQRWHHLALSYSQDTQTTRFHLNGEMIFEKQQDLGKLGHAKTPIRIGLGINTEQARYFKGMMAGFRLWPRALTHEETQDMVKRERPKVANAYRKPGALRPKKAMARPIDVGDRKQLFIDDRFIEVSKNVELTMNPPRKLGPVLRPNKPWETNYLGFCVSVVEHEGLYKMWYLAAAPQGGYVACYATSKDGLRWTKPNLGLYKYDDDKNNNNIVMKGVGEITVFLDPVAPAAQRFKMVCVRHWPNREKGGLYIHCSPDGIHWKQARDRVLPLVPDTANQVMYDKRLEKYVAYIRCWDPMRKIMRIEMDDVLKPWPFKALKNPYYIWGKDKIPVPSREAPVVFGYDEQDPVPSDHYNAAAVQYPWADDAYLMFPSAYLHLPPPPIGEFANCGPLDIQMATSRDGVQWNRLSRWPYVPLGLEGAVDSKCLYMAVGMVRKGDEILQFYGGMDFLHGDTKRRHGGTMCAVSQRLDGFVSADAAYTGGEFLTPPITFTGGRLELNVDCSALGVVRVAILDAKGIPIEGYTDSRCDPIHGNHIRRVVTWRDDADISELAGRPVRLHFVMRAAKLYAFQFAEGTGK